MKKRTLAVLLAAVLAASAFTGCGNRMEGDGKVQAAVADAESGQSESGSSSEAETGESETTESEPEATAEPSPEPTAEPESSAAAEADTSAGNESGQVEAGMGTAVGYTFTEMKETMYAKSQVNLRSLPSTDGEKIGKLSSGEEVQVTGKCAETGWYRIVFKDGTAYVSDSYIVSEKPSTQTANLGADYSASGNAERNRVLAAANEGSSGTAGGSGQQSQESSTSSGLSVEFVNYLNQQRAAAGLQQISWDDNLAAKAQRRAQEIVTNFSHDGSGNYLENILYGGSGSASDWYTQWYNSEGHRITMFQEHLSAGGCAFYQVDGIYYVVFTAKVDIPVQSAEEWNETKKSGEWTQVQTEEGDGFNTYVSDGETGGIVTDEQTNADIDAALREAGLIP